MTATPRVARPGAWLRALGPEVLPFVVITALVPALYFAVRAPVLDSPQLIDPWIYTASFTNYRFLLETFPTAYYLTRLPWIIPGVVANELFSPVSAFFVMHGIFFFGAGLFAFLLFRRFLGVWAALLGYAALMFTPLFYDAFRDDYPDGGILTYLLGGAYFALSAWGSKRRVLRFMLSGFFLAGAAGTNPYALVSIAGIALLYVAVFSVEPRFWLHAVRDVVSAIGGGLVMLVVCGGFSLANGGPFLFFVPSVNAAKALYNGRAYKADGFAWMKGQPQLLVPLFALAALVLLLAPRLRRDWKTEAGIRFAAGAGLLLALVGTLVCLWEFFFGGALLETSYYFSAFNLGISATLASVFFLLLDRATSPASRSTLWAVVIAGVVAAALPTLALYRLHWGSFGEPGARVTVALMAVGLFLVGAASFLSRRVALFAAPSAALVILFACNYAGASGLLTQTNFSTTPSSFQRNRETLLLGQQLIAFMRDFGFQDGEPAYPAARLYPEFWYDIKAEEAFNGMNAMYLWAYTWAGLDLPHIDKAMHGVLDARRPAVLVLLCLTRQCSGARAALARAGYDNRLLVERRLASGDKHAWAIALQLVKFRKPL
jgi:hypothetical protein